MLNVQQFLQTNTLDDLYEQYGVKAKWHSKYPELVLLKYDQIKSPKSHPIVRECRGLILNSIDWSVVSRPLDRFYNLSESCADRLDPASTVAYEKLDGSLMCLYYWDGAWQVQTSGTPDASGLVSGTDISFAELFWQTWQSQLYQLPFGRHDLTFVFELTGPLNQIVVQYAVSSISLLAVRSRSTGLELDSESIAKQFGWDHAKRYDNSNLDMAASPTRLEGYVLVDKHCNRVKIKTEQYVAMHRSANSMTDADAMRIVMAGEVDEVVSYLPKYAELLLELQAKWLYLIKYVGANWDRNCHLLPDRKAFALQIVSLPCKDILFAIASGKDWQQLCKDSPERTVVVARNCWRAGNGGTV